MPIEEPEVKQEEPQKFFLQPWGARIVVEEDDFKYTGKLVIPDNAKRRTTTGRIIAVGREAQEDFVIGERVLYAQFSGQGVFFQNRPSYRVLSIEEILCKIVSEDILEALER
jgi:co-chaperonin GroES (HSP10)